MISCDNKTQNLINMEEILIHFLIDLNDKGLINNHDFDYEKVAQGFANKDENKQLIIADVSNRRELLIAYEKNHYTPQEWVLASEQCIEDIDNFLAINCC